MRKQKKKTSKEIEKMTNTGKLTDGTELDLGVDFRLGVLVIAKTSNESD